MRKKKVGAINSTHFQGEKNMEKNNFGDNQLLGFYENYAIVFSFEDEKLYYYESEVIEDMIGCAVEKDLLKKVDMLPEKEQTEILKKYLKE
ncbi:hypothetical protein CLONEX_01259 [[Clostridium] nexile DSM 1787]|nr:hypothetical protein CLONEX_01259 [[Clostridium] nexile DSM 1787]